MKNLEIKNKKDTFVRSRINEGRKENVARILEKLGMNHSEAINLFYAQIELLKGLPFSVNIPNEKTQKVVRESNEGKNREGFHTKKDFFKRFGM
ncbi:MAG: type II toxin-antitoxin system antitoxin, RelB/DinJ family [Verrucomicrobia bacterium]|nr:MAG: type II toxin-antitoxin system antitoxin, RelB/DinJ family [Verrucomicrobiota bacterium]